MEEEGEEGRERRGREREEGREGRKEEREEGSNYCGSFTLLALLT